jgi:acyl-coenzyme A thioesterase PaaI-like protein
MEFLRPAPVGVLLVEGRILRFGRRSCVVDTAIHRSGREELVAHAVVTYAPVFPGSAQM